MSALARQNVPRPIVRKISTSALFAASKIDHHGALALCVSCQHKFNHRYHNYVPATRWGRCVGTCDGCGEHTNDQTMYIHESTVASARGIRSGEVYTPK